VTSLIVDRRLCEMWFVRCLCGVGYACMYRDREGDVQLFDRSGAWAGGGVMLWGVPDGAWRRINDYFFIRRCVVNGGLS
jgi:hypothetical protein